MMIYPINTLSEAAVWLSKELGEDWTEKRIIVEGSSGNVTLLSSIPDWVESGEGELDWRDGDGKPGTVVSDGLVAIDSHKLELLMKHGRVSLTGLNGGWKDGNGDPLLRAYGDVPFVDASHLRVRRGDLERFCQEQKKLGPATAESATADDASAAAGYDVFRKMPDLTPEEVSITFLANDLLEISARDETRRIPSGSFGLIDRRRGGLNSAGTILSGMAIGASLKAKVGDKENKKIVSDLRRLLKRQLGLNKDPFYRYCEGEGYRARFKLADKRNAADERAKQDARRRTEQFNGEDAYHLQAAGHSQGDYTCTEEDDQSELDVAASTLLKNHGQKI